jgi:hypothetical protein
MADGGRSREHHGEGFWRARHETRQQSQLNQRDCEAHGLRSRRLATGGRSSKLSRSRGRASCFTGAAGSLRPRLSARRRAAF